jgi:hypothetical protein
LLANFATRAFSICASKWESSPVGKRGPRHKKRPGKQASHKHGLLDQLVRLPACHAGGHGFESRTDRQVSSSWLRLIGNWFTSFLQTRRLVVAHVSNHMQLLADLESQ